MDYPDRAGRLRIHYAVVDDNIDELKDCITSGQDVNAQEEQGWTPLHFAADGGNINAAKILLEAGANTEIANNRGYTPIALAAASPAPDSLDVAKVIYQYGGNPYHKNMRGNDTVRFLELLSPGSQKKELLELFRERGVE